MTLSAKGSRCRPIIVLGPERSGTSVVAEMVHRWGAYAGEPGKIRPADEHNARGYWEYLPIWDFLVELGDLSAGTSWWDPSFQELVHSRLSVPRYADRAREMIAEMGRSERPWVWKDPALAFCLSFWTRIWGDAVYIVTVRNPCDVAQSWKRFVLSAEAQGPGELVAAYLLRWQYIMLLILQHTEGVADKLFLAYENVLRAPIETARTLAGFMDRTVSAVSDDTCIEAMAQAVDPTLCHYQTTVPLAQVSAVTPEQEALYDFVSAKIEDPFKPFDETQYPLRAGWSEFVKEMEGVARSLQPQREPTSA